MADYIVSSGRSMTVSTTTRDGFIVSSGGQLRIASGGTILSDGVLGINGGFVKVEKGGSTLVANIYSGRLAANGSVSGASVYSSGQMEMLDGSLAAYTTIKNGGKLSAYGAVLQSTYVSGGSLWLASGLSTTSKSYASNTQLLNSNAYMEIRQGGSAFKTELRHSSCNLVVSSGGSATSNSVSAGTLTVCNGGSAQMNYISNGAYMFVNSGGHAESNYVSYGGLFRIYNSGFASSSYVSNGGVMDVFSNGVALDTTIYSGGSLYIGAQAVVYRTIMSGGSATMYGRCENGVYSAGIVNICSGASSYAETFYCSAIVEGVGISSGVVSQATLGAGASVQVWGGRLEGRTISNATVNLISGYVGLSSVGGLVAMVKDGNFWVSSGAMNSAYVNNGGKLYMMHGATANLVNVSSGGHCGVASGCTVSGANVGMMTGSNRGTIGISSGGKLINGKISGTVEIGLGGSATQLMIDYGGSAIVSGTVNSTLVSSGTLGVFASGMVSSTTLKKGNLNIYGTVSSANLESNARMVVFSGGTVKSGTVCGSATISNSAVGSGLLINSGGSLNVLGAVVNLQTGNGTVHINSGGRLSSGTVSSGGTVTLNGNAAAFSCTVSNGGVMRISSGATIAKFYVKNGGKVTGYYNCGNVEFSSGANADINIFNLSAGNASAPVSGLDHAMNKGVLFTLTVSASQSKGMYKIASHASGFRETITVQNMYGDALGTLKVGQVVDIGGVGYKLDLDSKNVLSVTVGAEDPASTGPAKGDRDGNGVSDVLFVWTGEHGEGNYQHGYWMNGTKTWQSANCGHPANWDNLGCYDMNGNGKADSVLFGNVDAYEVPSAYIGYYQDGIDTDENWVTIGFLTNAAGIDWKNKVGNLTGGSANSIVWYAAELGALGAWTDGTDNWINIGGGFDSTWTLIGCGDFSGDGKDQVVMAHNSTEYYAIDIDGTWTNLGTTDSGWEVRAIGDFSGDGKDDIITFHKGTGIVAMWIDGINSVTTWSQLGQLDAKDWFVVGAGDYNGDETDDLLVRQNSTGMLGYYKSADLSKWVELGRGVDMQWTVIA